MVRVLITLAVLAAIFWVVTIVDCAVQPSTRHRGVPKRAWIFIVVLLPVFGGVLWFVLGRARPQQKTNVRAPDDDVTFLSSLTRDSDREERIRRLEEELGRLDAEENASEDGETLRRLEAQFDDEEQGAADADGGRDADESDGPSETKS